jgi:methylated-DNA-protein-cysteine methyltransferase-like protein
LAAGSRFFEQVYELVRQVPEGHVTTYGELARQLGSVTRSREVGWAMQANSEPDVPAHRVINTKGELSGGWAFGGYEVQRALLEAEGVGFDQKGRVILKEHLWTDWR